MCLFESDNEVEKDRHTNLIFKIPTLNATIATSLSNVENVHLLMFKLCNLHVRKLMLQLGSHIAKTLFVGFFYCH